MGESCRARNVLAFLSALEQILYSEGLTSRLGAGLEAAAKAT